MLRDAFPLRAMAAILIAGTIAYANGLHGPLIFDDRGTLETNDSIRQLAASFHPPRQTSVTGRPITNLTFALNYAVGGLDVSGYHLVNIALHLLAGLTLFGLLRRNFAIASLPWVRDRKPDHLALACALVWVLHPLNTEAVDYLTQRTELLAGLMFLITLYAAGRAASVWSTVDGAGSSTVWSLLAIGACACGMASKESMVVAPVMVVVYDRVFLYRSFREALHARMGLYLGLASTWLILGLLAPETPFFSASGFDRQISRWAYLVNQAPMVTRYLRLSVWPRGLVLDYGALQPLSLADVWQSAGIVLGLFVLTVVALLRVPALGFWGVWFFVLLAPSSGAVAIPTEVGAERRMYLPLVAVVVVAVIGATALLRALSSWWKRIPSHGDTTENRVAASDRRLFQDGWRLGAAGVALLAVVIVFSGATLQRNAEYRSPIRLWQTVVERWPHPRAHLNLAAELRKAGRHDDAITELRIAAPDLPEARRAMAFELIGKGDVLEAIDQLSAFVTLRPHDPEIVEAREVLADALVTKGDFAEARRQFDQILRDAPGYVTGHLKLADLLVTMKDFDAAIGEYQATLRLQPANVRALAHLAAALAANGRMEEAISSLRRALELYPDYDAARRDLVSMLLALRRYDEAEKECRALIARQPDDAEAHNGLGVALASQGRVAEALEQFREAVRLNPGASEPRNNLERAMRSRD